MANSSKNAANNVNRLPLPDEQTPLLTNSEADPTSDPITASSSTSPSPSPPPKDQTLLSFPTTQILLLCYARLVEPIAFFSIFPFINSMVQRNGSLPESSVGFYSGLIESLFSLTQMLVMIFWGRLSDKSGRKPVLVASMLGVSVTSSLFGLATTLWQMILFRCVAGVFAGTIVTIRVMITELSTEETQARAFSWFMFANNLGIFLGPLLGGVLADPAALYGFKGWFWDKYPYALSTFVTGAVGLTATVAVAIWVEETLPAKKKKGNVLSSGEDQANNGKPTTIDMAAAAATTTADMATNINSDGPPKPMSTSTLMRQPGIPTVLALYSSVMLLSYAWTAVIPVFWFTSIRSGGFGFTPLQISLMLALTGFSQAIWTLFAFPPLQRRFGTGWVLRVCSVAYLFFFLQFPLLNLLLRHADAYHVEWEKTLFWVLAPTLLCVGVGISMQFTAIQLALNGVNPLPETLGMLNGIALALASGVRAFSPALFTSLYAVGVKTQFLGGQLVWLIMLVLVFGFIVTARNMPEKAEGRPTKKVGQESQTENGQVRS